MLEIILTMPSSDSVKGRNGILETVKKDKCSVVTKKKKGEGVRFPSSKFLQIFIRLKSCEVLSLGTDAHR